MSQDIEKRAVELLWKQWTAVGVSGTARRPRQAIDLEAMIVFTPHIATADPRLRDESTDWCIRIGRGFISISRLRQLARLMPPPATTEFSQSNIVAMLLAKVGEDDFEMPHLELSEKSRTPSLEIPCLLQLRSRHIFGVGARADVLSMMVMRGRAAGPDRAAAFRPTGYTKQAVAAVLDDLSQTGILKKLAGTTGVVRYDVAEKESALRALLAPLPKRLPRWAERFAVVAHILETWRKFGTRATYVVELVKVLERIRPLVTAAGTVAPMVGRPQQLRVRIERWAASLLDDDVWEDVWELEGQDITHDILVTLNDDLVEVVQSDSFPVGYTELEQLEFRNIDSETGRSEFVVQFSAEHPSEDFDFNGYVDGTFRFDPEAETKAELLDSVKLETATAHFDMGEPDERS